MRRLSYFFLRPLLLPQFLAPTLRHLATAPEAYAEGQTLYLALTFFAQASLAFFLFAGTSTSLFFLGWWTTYNLSVCSFSLWHVYFLLDLAPEHFQRFLDKLLGVLGSFCLDLGRRFLIPSDRAQ